MKRIGKKLLAVGLALSMVLLTPGIDAEAVEHIDGCRTSMKRIECIMPLYAAAVETHTYYSGESGMSYCDIIIYCGRHMIYCANPFCYTFIASENRTCQKAHQKKCGSMLETGFCQY